MDKMAQGIFVHLVVQHDGQMRLRQLALAAMLVASGHAASETLNGARLLEVARMAIPPESVSGFQAPRLPRDLVLPAGEVTLAARPFTDVTGKRDRLVWIELRVDGRLMRVIAVRFMRRADGRASIDARASLQAAARGRSDAHATASFRGSALPLANATAMSGKSEFPGNSEKTEATTLPAVRRGEWATLRTASGAVNLESRVQILQDGRAGQAVRVKAAGAMTAILAQVIAAHEVEISE